jgi:hypothetical protein
VNAQDFSFGADVQSRYVWRGIQLGDESASLQPSVELAAGNFTVGAWGAYSLGGGSDVAQEMDLYVSYALSDAISVTVTDYYFPVGKSGHNYLELDSETTGHVYEATLSFAGTDAFPVALTVASNVGGASTGSTYLEASYALNELSLFAGGVVGDDDGYYNTDGTGLINVGISLAKEIQLSSTFSLPVNTSLVLNPDAGNVFLTFGFTL